MNLVEQMMRQLLAGDTLGQLADAAGAGQDDTKKAISAAVPALLSGLGSLASKPEGANKLWSTLKSVDDNTISDLGGMLTGGKSDQVAKTGTSILESLFGKGMIAALISALASFLGGKTALVTKLLPMLAPFLIGMIGKQVKSGGLDLGGLTKLILGQKGNIAAAMPQGLLSSLTGVQGLGDLTGFAKGAAAAVGGATKAAGATATRAVEEAASPLKWLLPLLALAAILLGGWWLMNRPKAVPKPVAPPAGATRPTAAPERETTTEKTTVDAASLGIEELTKSFTGLFDTAGKTLDSVTDATTAQAALPKLQALETEIDALSATFGKLPTEARSTVTKMVDASTKAMQEKANTVLGLPGVGDILKSVIEGIIKKLTALVTG